MTLSLPDFLYSQLERHAFRDGDHPCGKRSFVWRGHGIVVRGASAHRCSEGICRLGASGRRDRFNSFCDYGGKNLLGRAGTANLLAAAFLRISLPRACIRLTAESMSVMAIFRQLHTSSGPLFNLTDVFAN